MATDRNLTPDELADKYQAPNGGWGEHPIYSRGEWGQEAAEGNIQSGYWQWVADQIEQEDS